MSLDSVTELHERLFTIDTHSDTPTASFLREGWDFAARHDATTDRSQCDLPRMREGGIDALVFAVYVGQLARTAEGLRCAHEQALRCFEPVNAVHPVKMLSHQPGFVALHRANAMPHQWQICQ